MDNKLIEKAGCLYAFWKTPRSQRHCRSQWSRLHFKSQLHQYTSHPTHSLYNMTLESLNSEVKYVYNPFTGKIFLTASSSQHGRNWLGPRLRHNTHCGFCLVFCLEICALGNTQLPYCEEFQTTWKDQMCWVTIPVSINHCTSE